MPSFQPRPEPPVVNGLTMITPRPQAGGFAVWENQHGMWRIFQVCDGLPTLQDNLDDARRVARKQQRRLWPYQQRASVPT